MTAFREYLVGIKGPLSTPVGGGIRSLNVALRQDLDLYACVRPVRWFKGVPSPVKEPHKTDMCIFRENTEDIYAGIEFAGGSDEVKKFLTNLKLVHLAASLGSVSTLAGPPRTTSHVELTEAQRAQLGIPEGLIRYSVGIENPDDLLNDLDESLRLL